MSDSFLTWIHSVQKLCSCLSVILFMFFFILSFLSIFLSGFFIICHNLCLNRKFVRHPYHIFSSFCWFFCPTLSIFVTNFAPIECLLSLSSWDESRIFDSNLLILPSQPEQIKILLMLNSGNMQAIYLIQARFYLKKYSIRGVFRGGG